MSYLVAATFTSNGKFSQSAFEASKSADKWCYTFDRDTAQALYEEWRAMPTCATCTIAGVIESTDYDPLEAMQPQPQLDTVDILAVWEATLELDGAVEWATTEGVVSARQACVDTLAPLIDAAWTIASQRDLFGDCFDWDWCPSCLAVLMARFDCVADLSIDNAGWLAVAASDHYSAEQKK